MKTKLDEMWTAWLAYQHKADAAGHGKSWARMCKKRTNEATYAATADNAADNAAYAAYAAADAAYADWAQLSIDHINAKIKEKNT